MVVMPLTWGVQVKPRLLLRILLILTVSVMINTNCLSTNPTRIEIVNVLYDLIDFTTATIESWMIVLTNRRTSSSGTRTSTV